MVMVMNGNDDNYSAGTKVRAAQHGSPPWVDLLAFTVESLQKDVGLNAFAARKICSLRDAFLS